jgi:molybdate transport system substrate-binding protein
MGRRLRLVALLACGLALASGARAATLTVFAAASLRGALEEAARPWEAASGHRLRIAYAASGALARQVEAGAPAQVFLSADLAPAQVFLSADLEWMRYLEGRGLLQAPARDLLGNELVLVAPAGRVPSLQVAPGFPLAQALGGGRLALADPRAVPAGKYARAALQSLRAWDSVAARIAPADNVRAALNLVARGEAPLGIVYRTDAIAEPGVAIVGAFPASSHAPIVYPVATLKGAPPEAASLVEALRSPAARAAWERHGFRVLAR